MSYGYMKKEQRLRAEIDALLRQAHDTDAEEDAALGSRRGDELPAELQRRQHRLAVIAAAKQRLEEQARPRPKPSGNGAQRPRPSGNARGQKRRGKEPEPVSETPDDKAQTNFTDPELKMMKANNKGWDYCGNAQSVCGRDLSDHRGL